MVPAREKRLAGRSAQRRRMEAVVLETLSGETLGRRRRTRTAERTRRGEADVVEQNDENVRRSVGRPQLLDRRKRGVRVLRVQRKLAVIGPIRDRKNISLSVGPAQTRTASPLVRVRRRDLLARFAGAPCGRQPVPATVRSPP